MNEEMLEQEISLPSLADADSLTLAEAARDLLDAKKASDLSIICVEGRSDITDYLVLATGTSAPHVKALAGELEYRLGLRDAHPLHTDGLNTRSWQIVDYGTVMVHIFDRETRAFFNLDKLYKEEKTEASE
ncbi:MAG: ribosome silencing factor [Ruminococcaceae bacterium]|nr:ribosome silencing factor [Oscillospiraceae bacterium]